MIIDRVKYRSSSTCPYLDTAMTGRYADMLQLQGKGLKIKDLLLIPVVLTAHGISWVVSLPSENIFVCQIWRTERNTESLSYLVNCSRNICSYRQCKPHVLLYLKLRPSTCTCISQQQPYCNFCLLEKCKCYLQHG